ncbi:MAG: hypothetical protein QNK24_03195 [Desulfuromusa sp.]|nr:hypothetical protein [Desulfuromusa sp.]
MSRILIIQIFLLVFLITTANAEIVESWICQENSNGDWSKIIVAAKVNNGREDGVVEMSGVKNISNFDMKSINRRWKFGASYEYSFVIKPDGEAMYYDYSKVSKVKPQISLFCKQKELAKKKVPSKKINRTVNTSEQN